MTDSPWNDTDRASWRHCTTLESMRGWWKGSDCVVVAGGPSASPNRWEPSFELLDLGDKYEEVWTLACNRATKYCHPDFVAAFEPRKDTAVWEHIKDTPALLLSHIDRDHPRTVLTGSKDDVKPWITGLPNDGGDMVIGQSTYFALACAIVLGFETIGVIGLDLTPDRYDAAIVRDSNAAYRALNDLAVGMDRRLVNLNPDSRLTALQFGGWDEVRCK